MSLSLTPSYYSSGVMFLQISLPSGFNVMRICTDITYINIRKVQQALQKSVTEVYLAGEESELWILIG